MKSKNLIIFFMLPTMLLSSTACNKFLDTQLPSGTILGNNVYVSDNSVSSVVTANLLNISNNSLINGQFGYNAGLYTDELQNLNTGSGDARDTYYKNALNNTTSTGWPNQYSVIYDINAAIEGISGTTATLYDKNQWLGESLFCRALMYFYLTNKYGAVPLALTTNVQTNNSLKRATQDEVYQQIIKDLEQAQSLLSSDYRDGFGATTTNRVRPNRAAATALLAKAFLYNQKYDSAEIEADSVIANSAYQLEALNNVFAINSQETVWALALSSTAGVSSYEYQYYHGGMPDIITPPNTPKTYSIYLAITPTLLNAFESGDARFTNWIRKVIVSASATTPEVDYYFPNKYSSSTVGSANEVVLRLAEIYLIRAEAKARQNKLTEATADLNVIRTRAGLPNTTATTQTQVLNAIAHERQIELFTECGNRFFDLKRTSAIDSVMAVEAPQKNVTWNSYMQLWPLPASDSLQDSNLYQNPGY